VIDPDFKPLLASFSEVTLESEAGPIYGMWPDYRLAYLGQGWGAFARNNGGHERLLSSSYLGVNVLELTPANMQPFYAQLFSRCVDRGSSARSPVQHEYECSSATRYRRFLMSVYPLQGGRGLLVVNSRIVDQLHDPAVRTPRRPDRAAYLDEHGLIPQCTHCRRVQNMRIEKRWDWVPEWVERIPPEASHTLCRYCFDSYYVSPTSKPRS